MAGIVEGLAAGAAKGQGLPHGERRQAAQGAGHQEVPFAGRNHPPGAGGFQQAQGNHPELVGTQVTIGPGLGGGCSRRSQQGVVAPALRFIPETTEAGLGPVRQRGPGRIALQGRHLA